MSIDTWIKLLGKNQHDSTLKKALVSAGVKKIPKLDRDNSAVLFDIKGHGLSVEMVDEAYLKDLAGKEKGDCPLILSGVCAYLVRKKNNDLYKGKLPYDLSNHLTQDQVREIFGPSQMEITDVPADIWLHNGLVVTVGFTKELKMGHLTVELPWKTRYPWLP
jgi:hypothetical protein